MKGATSRRSLAFLLLPGAILWNIACQSRPKTPEQEFNLLFEGYRLVLITDLPKDKPIQDITASDFTVAVSRPPYPLEPRLAPGRVYILRKANDMSNETLALKIFPKRLSKIGARITRAPHSAQDLMDLIMGGPLFNIEFEKDGHKGRIFNDVHMSGKDRENWEELILAYL